MADSVREFLSPKPKRMRRSSSSEHNDDVSCSHAAISTHSDDELRFGVSSSLAESTRYIIDDDDDSYPPVSQLRLPSRVEREQLDRLEQIERQRRNTPRLTRFQFSNDLTLEAIREMQAEFSEERNWDQFHTPRNLLLAMVGEVGEVSELFQWRNEAQVGLPDWTHADRTHLSEELSDVLIYLVRLAEQCHIDLAAAVRRKIGLNHSKYPVEKAFGSSKKYTEYSKEESKPKDDGYELMCLELRKDNEELMEKLRKETEEEEEQQQMLESGIHLNESNTNKLYR